MRERVEDALCPRCGITKPQRADECPGCGVVYRKYEAAVRRRQLEAKPAPAAGQGHDWNRLPLYAGVVLVMVALWQAGTIWHRSLAAVDEATRVNSVATGGAPVEVLAFSCGPADDDGMLVARGAVQNRTQHVLSVDADVAYVDRADGIDKTIHASVAISPDELAPLAVGRFELRLRRYPRDVAECRVAGLVERGSGAPIVAPATPG